MSSIRSSYAVCLVVCLLLLLAGCGGKAASPVMTGSSSPELTDPLPDDAASAEVSLSFSGLLSPGSIARDVSVSKPVHSLYGAEYGIDLPNHLVTVDGTGLRFTPNWTREAGGELAYAIYEYYLPGFGPGGLLDLQWAGDVPTNGDVWVGVSDWSGDCWEWYAQPEEGYIEIDEVGDYIRAEDDLCLVVTLLAGQTPAKLAVERFIAAEPVVVEGVNPTAGATGRETVFCMIGSGTEPLEYSWDFGGGAVPNTSTAAEPVVTLGAVGIYAANLIVSNPYGPAVEYSFDLEVLNGQWPMSRFDRRQSGCCPYVGCQTGELAWSNTYDGDGYSGEIPADECLPVIGADGTVYVGAEDEYIYAFNPDGSLYWRYPIGEGNSVTGLAIGTGGVILAGIFSGSEMSVITLDPTGGLEWSYDDTAFLHTSPVIAPDGRIMVAAIATLIALNPDGSLDWKQTMSEIPTPFSQPAVDGSGVIYAGGSDDNVIAINPDGTLRWAFPVEQSPSSTCILAPDGTFYVASSAARSRFFAFRPNGSVMWSIDNVGDVDEGMALGPDGTIYTTGSFFEEGQKLNAVNPDGSVHWAYDEQGLPSVGVDGTVYFSDNGDVIALYPDGTVKWQVDLYGTCPGVAIGADGTVVVGNNNGVYAFRDSGAVPVTIHRALPEYGNAGAHMTFGVDASGTEPFSYAWDFGDAATPSTSTEVLPTVVLGEAGVYQVTVTVDNECNAPAVYQFTLSIGDTQSATVGSVTPREGITGFQYTMSAIAGGTPPLYYTWDFGAGAVPAVSHEPAPYVKYLEPGVYQGSVTVDNEYGPPAVHVFEYEVLAPAPPIWPMDGADMSGTGCTPYYGPRTFNVAWHRRVSMSCHSSAVIAADGSLLVGSDPDDCLYCLESDGTYRWSYHVDWCSDNIETPVLGPDGSILVVFDEVLHCLNMDGSFKWSYDAGRKVYPPRVGADGQVFFFAGNVSNDCGRYQLNPDGTLAWTLEMDSLLMNRNVLDEDGSCFASDNYYLYRFNPGGAVSQSHRFIQGVYPPSLNGNILYCVSDGSRLVALEKDTFEEIWHYDLDTWGTGNISCGPDGSVYCSDRAGKLYALDSSGNLRWTFAAAAYLDGAPVVDAANTLYFTTYGGPLYAVDGADGTELWNSGETIVGLQDDISLGDDGTLYAVNLSCDVYAIRDE